jgi:hypothetical protein
MSINTPNGPNALILPRPTFTISIKYVNGEMKTIGDKVIGINRGLMNTNGNLIRTVNIIVFPGVSVEGTESIRLKQAKAKPAINIPAIIRRILTVNSVDRKIIPIIKGIEEKIIPYRDVLQTLPNNIVFIDIGQVTNLSNVFLAVSHGKTIGPIEVEVRKMIIVINPEIK